MRLKRLPHRKHFIGQLQKAGAITIVIVVFSLLLGAVGYWYFFNLEWADALYNASMILTGMGPVAEAKTTSAKLFGTFYALYSGVAFLTSISVMMTPIYQRYIHKIHLNIYEDNEKK
ncbi:MAG: hypothetical protein KatS3mg027_0559 [Bacteroidia bacterium]|nr:MAG: hypothetical protein KatS3mg027_0559 [Bacteroidia bacterium]